MPKGWAQSARNLLSSGVHANAGGETMNGRSSLTVTAALWVTVPALSLPEAAGQK
jgi:hypothetical protein